MKVREKLILYTHPNCDYSPMKKDELNCFKFKQSSENMNFIVYKLLKKAKKAWTQCFASF